MSSDFERSNPYASPADASPALATPLARSEALRQLRVPALGLMGTSVFSLAWATTTILTGVGPPLPQPPEWLEISAMAALLFVLPLVILVASFQVVRGKTKVWPWVAIVGGLVPLGTGCVCAGIPFALWLLVLMLRSDIRTALV